MRSHFLTILCLFLSISLSSYGQRFSNCKYTYFKNGKIATSQCYDSDDRWGQARAYNDKGAVIYEKELRKIAGHSSVQFSFYENGAVKKAVYSSAPDAGIQWYRTYTTFAPDGTITSEVNDSHDNSPGTTAPFKRQEYITPSPTPAVSPAPAKPTPTTIACAVIYSSEYWFFNTTPYSVVVTATHKYRKTEMTSITLRPRQSAKGGQVIQAQFFDDPAKQYDFSVRAVKPGNKTRFIILPSDKLPEQTSKENQRFYFDIRRII